MKIQEMNTPPESEFEQGSNQTQKTKENAPNIDTSSTNDIKSTKKNKRVSLKKTEEPFKNVPKKKSVSEIEELPSDYKKLNSASDDQGEYQLYRKNTSKDIINDGVDSQKQTNEDDTENFNFFQKMMTRFGCWIYVIFGILIGLIGILVMYIKRKCLSSSNV